MCFLIQYFYLFYVLEGVVPVYVQFSISVKNAAWNPYW